MSAVNSPCVRECALDQDEICLGCLRSIEEIMQWSGADNKQKRQILARVESRRQQRRDDNIEEGKHHEYERSLSEETAGPA